jgi:hypothetical protein
MQCDYPRRPARKLTRQELRWFRYIVKVISGTAHADIHQRDGTENDRQECSSRIIERPIPRALIHRESPAVGAPQLPWRADLCACENVRSPASAALPHGRRGDAAARLPACRHKAARTRASSFLAGRCHSRCDGEGLKDALAGLRFELPIIAWSPRRATNAKGHGTIRCDLVARRSPLSCKPDGLWDAMMCKLQTEADATRYGEFGAEEFELFKSIRRDASALDIRSIAQRQGAVSVAPFPFALRAAGRLG